MSLSLTMNGISMQKKKSKNPTLSHMAVMTRVYPVSAMLRARRKADGVTKSYYLRLFIVMRI